MNRYLQEQFIQQKLNMIMEYRKIKIKKLNSLRRLKICVIPTVYLARPFINT